MMLRTSKRAVGWRGIAALTSAPSRRSTCSRLPGSATEGTSRKQSTSSKRRSPWRGSRAVAGVRSGGVSPARRGCPARPFRSSKAKAAAWRAAIGCHSRSLAASLPVSRSETPRTTMAATCSLAQAPRRNPKLSISTASASPLYRSSSRAVLERSCDTSFAPAAIGLTKARGGRGGGGHGPLDEPERWDCSLDARLQLPLGLLGGLIVIDGAGRHHVTERDVLTAARDPHEQDDLRSERPCGTLDLDASLGVALS